MKIILPFLALVSCALAQAPRPIFSDATPVIAPEALKSVSLPNTVIESVTVDQVEGSVRVTAIVTHPPASDRVKVWVALPLKNWNGRFMGKGGGGFLTGSPRSLGDPVAQGFAAASTDGGHEGGSGSFAINASGRLNWQEIRNFAYLSIHDMTVVGKALTAAFYGKPARYSYFIGSSTGGRQGLMEAQRYPEDYDGIFSGCPAINMDRMSSGGLWPQVVMAEMQNFVSKEKLDAVTAAVIAACDGIDGVVDGVIDDPLACTWDPKQLVGKQPGGTLFTDADAEVVRKIWAGPRGHDGRFIWYGYPRGANLSASAATEGTPLVGKPRGPSLEWFRYFVVQNSAWNVSDLKPGEFEVLCDQSTELWRSVIGSDNPDLTRFRARGGKLLMTHGLADQSIPPQGTIDYFERVKKYAGSAEKTAEFARLFLVPGVGHSFQGAGPSPKGTQDALIRWVEEGKAPDRLLGEAKDQAGKVLRTRPLFPYPQFAKYSGTGDPNDAANFVSRLPGK